MAGDKVESEFTDQFSQKWPELAEIAHVFTKEYAGISAAAYYLPGVKIPIPSQATELVSLEKYTDLIKDRIVFVHGMSDGLYEFIKRILRSLIPSEIYLVWHVNLTQLASAEELRLFALFENLSHFHQVRKVAFIRFENTPDLNKVYRDPILNSMPNLIENSSDWKANKSGRAVALLPSWMDIRKNLAFNIAISSGQNKISYIEHYADLGGLPKLFPKVQMRRVRYVNNFEHLMNLRKYSMVLNVSAIDCQPMVDLETLASGVRLMAAKHIPLRSILDHQLLDYCQIDPFNVSAGKHSLTKLLSLDQNEWAQISGDFNEKYQTLSRQTWARFIE